MGTSTNAYLAFGVDLGEEYPEAFANEDDDFDWFILDQAGFPDLEDGADEAATLAHYRKRRAVIDTFPYDMQTHCSYDYPMYFLCIRKTLQMASRGETTEVEFPEITEQDRKDFIDFCVRHGIGAVEPKWHIFSLWG